MPAVAATVRRVVGRLRGVGIGCVLRALLRAAVRVVGRVRGFVAVLGLFALRLVGFFRFYLSNAFLRSLLVVILTSVTHYL